MTKSDYDKPGKLEQVQKWLTTLKPAMPDPQKLETYIQPRRRQVLEAEAMFQEERSKYETLARQDYLPE
jgi:hypothetical protein